VALKPTIFKFTINLSDLNKDLYTTLNLTVAQHPSEKTERMMTRILCYCLNAQEGLSFTKGLSAIDEPDIWSKSLDDQLELWIDTGEPAFDRIKKASRLTKNVFVYSFNSKSDVWWSQEKDKFAKLPVSVFQFPWDEIQKLATLVTRTMDLSVTISGNTLYIAVQQEALEVNWTVLQE